MPRTFGKRIWMLANVAALFLAMTQPRRQTVSQCVQSTGMRSGGSEM